MIVTTGGQQVIDIVCKVLIDPGDVIVAEGPTYPGAVRHSRAYQAEVEQVPIDDDGMEPRSSARRLDDLDRRGKRPKLIYLIPNFQNPSGVTMSLERRRGVIEIARERELLILEDNPYGLLRYDGDPLPSLRRARRGRARDLRRHLLEDPLSRNAGSAGRGAPSGAREAQPRQAGSRPLQLVTRPDFVAAYVAGGGWPEYIDSLRGIYRRRRDVMLESLEAELPDDATWTVPKGGLFVWATLPDYIDTTDLLARALRENFAFVPGRAACVDGSGGSSMRLNFSGADESEIREGIRRIGAIMGEQVELFGTMTGRAPRPARKPPGANRRRVAGSCRSPRSSPRPKPAGMLEDAGSPCSKADARWSAGSRSGRAPGSGTLSSDSAMSRSALRRTGSSCRSCATFRRTPRSSPCTAATARTAWSRSCSNCSGFPTRGQGPRPALGSDKALAKSLMREAGLPTPDSPPSRGGDAGAGSRSGAARDRAQARLPAGGQAGLARVGAGHRPCPQRRRGTGGDVEGALIDDRVVLERYVTGRDLAVAVLGEAAGPRALPPVEAVPVGDS